LLIHGANINAADKQCDTAPFFALRECNPALVQLLIEKRADPDIKHGEGLTVLDIVKRHGLPEVLGAGRPNHIQEGDAKWAPPSVRRLSVSCLPGEISSSMGCSSIPLYGTALNLS
jgi:hypothetical protein